MTINPNLWEIPLAFPPLKKGEVHLWLAEVAEGTMHLPDFERILSLAEMERAKKYKVFSSYMHFVMTRGLLREALGYYMQINPKKVEFSYSQNGKPFVNSSIHFNISHSENYILLAFQGNSTIGVDIEYKNEIHDFQEISHRFFSRREYEDILATDSRHQIQKFYEIWVKKESYTKAIGGKIFDVLKEFKSKNLHIIEDDLFSIENISFNESYVAAFATEKPVNVKCWKVDKGRFFTAIPC